MTQSANSLGARRWPRGLQWVLSIFLLAALAAPAVAAASAPVKVVRYLGYQLKVPAGWPVFHVSASSKQCVTFSRHAVYLGTPGTAQQCPAHAAGRTEAILVQPNIAHAGSASALPSTSSAASDASAGSLARLTVPAHGVVVTATWDRDPAVIKAALGVTSLSALVARSHTLPAPVRTTAVMMHAQMNASSSTPAQVYTGYGFDACSAPSTTTMSKWLASPFRGVGVYIGGANIGCSQPNLTASWVTTESQAGWHILPIYVGLQAPANICRCASISTSSATSQGTAAAADAVAHAQALGMGAGNPIYDDMEAYSRTSTNTSAVLAFLSGWTTGLHAKGYKSGVYSSDGSGIADLVSRHGTSYTEPDVIWIANWNDVKSTVDGYVPSADWANHQRVHQYNGGFNATYGGVTINVDGDWLDAPTAAAGTSAVTAQLDVPSVKTAPAISGTPAIAKTLTEVHGTWSPSASSYTYQWEKCNATGASCVAISGATGQTYTVPSSAAGATFRVAETAHNSAGASTAALSSATATVPAPAPAPAPGDSSYYLYTAYGNVYNVGGATFYGSLFASHVTTSSIVGMALTRDHKGYWLADSSGQTFAYGDATQPTTVEAAYPVAGIVTSPAGGYWVFTTHGNVYGVGNAVWYGSPYHSGVTTSSITGMAATKDGKGYWLVTSTGQVYAYGDAANLAVPSTYTPLKGIVAAPSGGYWLFNVYGNVPYTAGTAWYGSPRTTSGVVTSSIAGMSATPDGKGYWVVNATGQVYAYGDAAAGPIVTLPHPAIGIAG